ncbi:MAG TPA: hypothetical protein PLG43_00820 [Spirochaetia bacterium]|nr:hypothetical protein [Spirochaetia bacterium]
MKRKLIVSFILLIIVGALVAFFGIVNIGFSADTYGVVFTKTSGFEESVVYPGKLVWNWKRLLPTNMTVYQFELTPKKLSESISGTLPSGDIYSRYVEANPSFSYRIDVDLSYRLKLESLPVLVKDKHLRPEGMDQLYAGYEEQFKAALKDMVYAMINEVTLSSAHLSPEHVQESLAQAFPQIEFIEVSMADAELPDLELYREAKAHYFAVNAIKEERTRETMRILTEREVTENTRIELLTRYGELFTKYPSLLEFFSIFKDTAKDFIPFQ